MHSSLAEGGYTGQYYWRTPRWSKGGWNRKHVGRNCGDGDFEYAAEIVRNSAGKLEHMAGRARSVHWTNAKLMFLAILVGIGLNRGGNVYEKTDPNARDEVANGTASQVQITTVYVEKKAKTGGRAADDRNLQLGPWATGGGKQYKMQALQGYEAARSREWETCPPLSLGDRPRIREEVNEWQPLKAAEVHKFRWMKARHEAREERLGAYRLAGDITEGSTACQALSYGAVMQQEEKRPVWPGENFRWVEESRRGNVQCTVEHARMLGRKRRRTAWKCAVEQAGRLVESADARENERTHERRKPGQTKERRTREGRGVLQSRHECIDAVFAAVGYRRGQRFRVRVADVMSRPASGYVVWLSVEGKLMCATSSVAVNVSSEQAEDIQMKEVDTQWKVDTNARRKVKARPQLCKARAQEQTADIRWKAGENTLRKEGKMKERSAHAWKATVANGQRDCETFWLHGRAQYRSTEAHRMQLIWPTTQGNKRNGANAVGGSDCAGTMSKESGIASLMDPATVLSRSGHAERRCRQQWGSREHEHGGPRRAKWVAERGCEMRCCKRIRLGRARGATKGGVGGRTRGRYPKGECAAALREKTRLGPAQGATKGGVGGRTRTCRRYSKGENAAALREIPPLGRAQGATKDKVDGRALADVRTISRTHIAEKNLILDEHRRSRRARWVARGRAGEVAKKCAATLEGKTVLERAQTGSGAGSRECTGSGKIGREGREYGWPAWVSADAKEKARRRGGGSAKKQQGTRPAKGRRGYALDHGKRGRAVKRCSDVQP
ncbi:hypothetical protein B0H11DRAFT_1941108 [Mycena galericulata]|nr:hypothetical protein B0H11DRAFT_1941108 [Mycena galericulata]